MKKKIFVMGKVYDLGTLSVDMIENAVQADLDKVRTTWQSSEQSVSSIQANIHNLRIQRGERDEHRNVTLQKSRNALDEAELNLGWTKVYAEADGTVSTCN